MFKHASVVVVVVKVIVLLGPIPVSNSAAGPNPC